MYLEVTSKPHSFISVNTANSSFFTFNKLAPSVKSMLGIFSPHVSLAQNLQSYGYSILPVEFRASLEFNLGNFLTSFLRRIQPLKCILRGISTSIPSLSLLTIKLVTPRNFNLQSLPVMHEMWGRTEICVVVKEHLVVLFIWVVASERMASLLLENCLNLCVLCLRAYNKLVKWFQLPFVYELYAKQFKTS